MAADARVEAARYALLRRLAPALRHGLVGKLHPVGLMSETLVRRMRTAPEIEPARAGLEKIHELSRSAMTACSSLITWLAPEEGDGVGLEEGMAECIDLLGTDLGMRGHNLRSELSGGQARVSRSAVRNLLSAALIAQSDSLQRASDIVVRSTKTPEAPELTIEWSEADRESMPSPDDAYRRLDWEEIQLLAGAESAQCTRAAGRITLRFTPMESA